MHRRAAAAYLAGHHVGIAQAIRAEHAALTGRSLPPPPPPPGVVSEAVSKRVSALGLALPPTPAGIRFVRVSYMNARNERMAGAHEAVGIFSPRPFVPPLLGDEAGPSLGRERGSLVDDQFCTLFELAAEQPDKYPLEMYLEDPIVTPEGASHDWLQLTNKLDPFTVEVIRALVEHEVTPVAAQLFVSSGHYCTNLDAVGLMPPDDDEPDDAPPHFVVLELKVMRAGSELAVDKGAPRLLEPFGNVANAQLPRAYLQALFGMSMLQHSVGKGPLGLRGIQCDYNKRRIKNRARVSCAVITVNGRGARIYSPPAEICTPDVRSRAHSVLHAPVRSGHRKTKDVAKLAKEARAKAKAKAGPAPAKGVPKRARKRVRRGAKTKK